MAAQGRDLDEFWDIDQLLPQRRATASVQSAPSHIEAVEIEVTPLRGESKDTPAAIPVPPKSEGGAFRSAPAATALTDLVYEPHHPLISRVSLYLWNGGFPYYESFCRMADRLFDRHGSECEPVTFFSYMPQYDQMNRSQMSWYLFWRDRVRAGEYLPTDYSYIFLYLFEIINLPDRIPPEQGQTLMCDIWAAYHKKYPLLHRYLAEWICDYSMIHRLPPPSRTDIVGLEEHTALKEFYACPTGDDATADAHLYLRFCCDYQYRKSKVYMTDAANAALMDTHIPAALSYALEAMNRQGKVFSQSKMQKTKVCRDSFIGALCSERMKRRIEVEYCSFQRSHEIRFLIRDMVKYSENKIRAFLGVKSKLSIYGLSDEIKGMINEYFARHLGASVPHTKSFERPDYEALYDVPHTPVSVKSASRIEQDSWELTARLVEAFSDETEEPPEIIEAPSMPSASEDGLEGLRPFAAFLTAVVHADLNEQKKIAAFCGSTPDALAERINEIFVDAFGDILLEQRGDGAYSVIEDYLDEIRPLT